MYIIIIIIRARAWKVYRIEGSLRWSSVCNVLQRAFILY